MRVFLSLISICLLLAGGTAWASIAGTTSASDFQDTVDWCVQFGCANNDTVFPSPQGFTSAGGATGTVGLEGTGQGFYNLQSGNTWGGDFPSGMGLVYNGASPNQPFQNTPTGIAVTFDSGNYGAGAYIDADYFGSFTARVELFNSLYQPIGTYTTSGASGSGTALFIGIIDSDPEVYAAEFWAWGTGPTEPDFAIGTMGIRTTPYTPTIPEPVSFLLLGPALIGMGLLKRRLSH